MSRFQGDRMPRRDENGKCERIVNIGMQDPRIVRGFPVLAGEIQIPEQRTPEHYEQEASPQGYALIDPVRAIHAVARACAPLSLEQ